MKGILSGLVLVLFAQGAFADAAAEINYRKAVMDSIGGHMKAMGTILRGRVHGENLAFHASAMADLAKVAPSVFPEGSGDGKTEALPEVWENPADFKAAMDKFVDAANTMATAAASGDMGQVGPAIQGLGQSCKGCHDDFREE